MIDCEKLARKYLYKVVFYCLIIITMKLKEPRLIKNNGKHSTIGIKIGVTLNK
jgi:hypothetical protein